MSDLVDCMQRLVSFLSFSLFNVIYWAFPDAHLTGEASFLLLFLHVKLPTKGLIFAACSQTEGLKDYSSIVSAFCLFVFSLALTSTSLFKYL